LPFLVGRDDVDIVAVWSRREETLRKVSALYGISACTTEFEKVLEKRPDCAFVLTTCETHPKYAIPLIESGSDVLCEKPMAWTIRDSEMMVEAAAKSGRILMIGFNRRYSVPYARAKRFFESGVVETCVVERVKTTGRPRCVAEDIVHNLDLLRWYCGEPLRVWAAAAGKGTGVPAPARHSDTRPFSVETGGPADFETSLVAAVSFDSGALGVAAVCFSAGRWHERTSISGGGRTAVIEAPDSLRLITAGEDDVAVNLTGSTDSWASPAELKGFKAQVEEFLECHLSRRTPLTNGADALKSMRLLDRVCREAGIPALE
jgi:virulence factor